MDMSCGRRESHGLWRSLVMHIRSRGVGSSEFLRLAGAVADAVAAVHQRGQCTGSPVVDPSNVPSNSATAFDVSGTAKSRRTSFFRRAFCESWLSDVWPTSELSIVQKSSCWGFIPAWSMSETFRRHSAGKSLIRNAAMYRVCSDAALRPLTNTPKREWFPIEDRIQARWIFALSETPGSSICRSSAPTDREPMRMRNLDSSPELNRT